MNVIHCIETLCAHPPVPVREPISGLTLVRASLSHAFIYSFPMCVCTSLKNYCHFTTAKILYNWNHSALFGYLLISFILFV